ncbi:MAG: sigma-54-dependent transcriptional regulator, partial [Planctomycetota bacterium]
MRKNASILIVEPDTSLAAKLAAAFENRGGRVRTARTFQQACEIMEEHTLELVLCETHLEKGNDGIAVMAEVQHKTPSVPVILISSTADIDACKEAIKLGAYDYLVKPLDMDELVRMAGRAIPSVPVVSGTEDCVFSGIISRSPSMQMVYRVLRRVSPTNMPILIEGESGTGKELTAKAIHMNSQRKDKP